MGLKEDATKILYSAYEQAINNPSQMCSYMDFIDSIIDNTHLTYKYVLFTALLAKATKASINPLCLQKKSTLPGAYDARTICHKVIVPFEMEILNKALGGSNEPFFNKPARFPELSKTNAVRRGNDQKLLNLLCDTLPLIATSGEAQQCLVYLLCKLIHIREEKKKISNITIDDSANLPCKLLKFINQALTHSYEGEILTLMVAGIYHLQYCNNPNISVEVHPVNQSGASGKEVSDLDIYFNGILLTSNELKDKEYAETDVRHAADKVIAASGTRMLFIEGPRAYKSNDFITALEQEYNNKNFMLSVVPCGYFFATSIASLEVINCEKFVRFVINIAQATKFKEEVILYLDELAQHILGLKH